MMSGPDAASPTSGSDAVSPGVAEEVSPTRDGIPAGRIMRWIAYAAGVFAVLLLLALWNNNFALMHPSRAQFNAQLDQSLDRSYNWIAAHPIVVGTTPPLMYMLADMEKMTGDPRLQKALDANKLALDKMFPARPLDPYWYRFIDPNAPLPYVSADALSEQPMDLRWMAYGIDQKKVPLSAEDHDNLFSRYKYSWGARHHQQVGLLVYRHFNGGSEDVDGTLNYLAEKQARDEHFDFRVDDAYSQRPALVLASGRPDLVRSRWIERILDYQNPDGTWKYAWYGWGSGVFEFNSTVMPSHPTVQAMWLLTQLKYRYPQWIEQHYH
jgi:hypothetical protein